MNLYKREHLQRWGFFRSFYAYCLLKLHRYFGFRLYQIRVRDLHDSGIERLDADGLLLRRARRDELLAAAADPALEPVDEHLRIAIPPRAMYRYKSFVLPRYRGRALLAGFNRLTDRDFIDAGKTTCVSYVDSHNFAMLRASARAGYRRAGFIALTEHPHRFRCWRSPGARALGVNFVERDDG